MALWSGGNHWDPGPLLPHLSNEVPEIIGPCGPKLGDLSLGLSEFSTTFQNPRAKPGNAVVQGCSARWWRPTCLLRGPASLASDAHLLPDPSRERGWPPATCRAVAEEKADGSSWSGRSLPLESHGMFTKLPAPKALGSGFCHIPQEERWRKWLKGGVPTPSDTGTQGSLMPLPPVQTANPWWNGGLMFQASAPQSGWRRVGAPRTLARIPSKELCSNLLNVGMLL